MKFRLPGAAWVSGLAVALSILACQIKAAGLDEKSQCRPFLAIYSDRERWQDIKHMSQIRWSNANAVFGASANYAQPTHPSGDSHPTEPPQEQKRFPRTSEVIISYPPALPTIAMNTRPA